MRAVVTGAGGYLFTEQELARVGVPSMLFLGERERDQLRGQTSMSQLADKVHKALPAPRYLLEVRGASHFSFNDRLTDRIGARLLSGTPRQFEVIRRYSIAFLEKHVAGRGDPEGVLEKGDTMLTRYVREDSESDESG